ncbi:MAG: hypothetical protein CL470_00665 [Acidimicrobiaceae bacterium]|nr:hypothetical protein [Acidimicrobiaceae bacterium]|tara:strand:+ start:477 stop:1508 length:1032 start_codon:yes stop_codon:yes gene_type:complete
MCLIEQCNSKSKYGGYCYKHRRNYLCNGKYIVIERFTNKESDYLKIDIINTILSIAPQLYTSVISIKRRKEAFNILSEIVKVFKKYDEKDIKYIISIQNRVKKKIIQKIDQLRGPGYINKKLCNNDTDFYSYDSIDLIDDKYFYSYKDSNDFIWFFDIRSLNKLIELKQPNPYTMKEIPNNIIDEVKELTSKLNLKEEDELINKKKIKQSKRQMIKQNTIDLFSDIDNSGYYCQPEWFLSLSMVYLKKLYKNLEDIWNYRLQITDDVKSRICPPNGLVFTARVSDVMRYNSKERVQELILSDIMKFRNAISEEDKKLGYMYFIIGLGSVSLGCWDTHQWLMYV